MGFYLVKGTEVPSSQSLMSLVFRFSHSMLYLMVSAASSRELAPAPDSGYLAKNCCTSSSFTWLAKFFVICAMSRPKLRLVSPKRALSCGHCSR
ncbi:uncharacterized protein DMAD_09213 [Drosophila madeirensis]|uniref:Uncharacterized protein n=1 Tax=Drosophila madeirensis TaxID=30013 RepID=A0AAU9F043_DROMD